MCQTKNALVLKEQKNVYMKHIVWLSFHVSLQYGITEQIVNYELMYELGII